jgi:phage terminase large subunit-like protein
VSLDNFHPELAPSPPHVIGPTWARTVDGGWWLPKWTLGWGILNWWHDYVKTPGGDQAGSAFMPTLEQARFVLWWYAVDENGDYVYREGILRRMKGWGKDPIAAALALAELCGPVSFSHWGADGQPVGKPRHAAWIQIAAVSQDQTKNTFRLFPVMISSKMKQTYGLEVNKFVIYSAVGGTIEAVTSSPASMEGNRPTFVIQNEIQYWGAGPGGEVNEGHAMADIIEGNVSKTRDARTLSICNAHIPGNDTVGERAWDSYQDVLSGKAVDVSKLYDAVEAPADTPVPEIPSQKDDPEGYEKGLQRLREGLLVARGDSYWLPMDSIVKSVLDVKNAVSESRRKFLNQINAHEDSWISPQDWNKLALTDPVFKLKRDDMITLGFDGSKSNDWTALVACRVSDGMLFCIQVWDPERHGGEVPREDVDAVVRSMFESYRVVAFRADVKEFEAYVDQWGRDFKKKIKVNATPGNPIAFDMRGQTKRFALDCERFEDAVLEREVFHDGNPILKQHVTNAKRHPTNFDAISIRKASKDSSRKIDAAVCAVLAFGGRHDYLMSKKNRTGGAVIIR